MKTITGLAAAAVAGLALFGAGPSLGEPGGFSLVPAAEARSRVSVSFSLFYNELRPHGRWVRHARYGQVWVPRHQRDWRPYTRGRWAMTRDYGWMWVSDEPFGWATYHYGSWDYDRRIGWYWVPGYVWGPAWVTWSDRGDYLGWAPIPASYLWGSAFDDFFYRRPVIHITFGDAWCYAPTRHFGSRRIDRHVVPPRQNVTIVNNHTTVVNNVTNITNVTIVDNRVYNYGVSVEAVNALAETPVEMVELAEASAAPSGEAGGRAGVVEVYRPVETPIADDPAVLAAISAEQTETASAVADDPALPPAPEPMIEAAPSDPQPAPPVDSLAEGVPASEPGTAPLDAAPSADGGAPPVETAILPDPSTEMPVEDYAPPAEAYAAPEPSYEAPVEAYVPPPPPAPEPAPPPPPPPASEETAQ